MKLVSPCKSMSSHYVKDRLIGEDVKHFKHIWGIPEKQHIYSQERAHANTYINTY